MDPITKKILIRNIIIQAIIYIVVGFAITIGILFFAQSFGIKGWIDGLIFAGALLMAFSWMIIISNANMFTTLVYGVKQFVTSLMGRKMEKDIVDYTSSRKIYGKEFILVPLSIGLFFIISGVILWVFFL